MDFFCGALGGGYPGVGRGFRAFAVGVGEKDAIHRLASGGLDLRVKTGRGFIQRMTAAVDVDFEGIDV